MGISDWLIKQIKSSNRIEWIKLKKCYVEYIKSEEIW